MLCGTLLKICHLVLIKLLLSLLIEIFKLKPNVCNIHSWSVLFCWSKSTFRDQTRERLNLRPGEVVHKVKNEMNNEQQLSSLHSRFNVKGFKNVTRKSFCFSCSGGFFLPMLFYFKHKHVVIMQCYSVFVTKVFPGRVEGVGAMVIWDLNLWYAECFV